MADTITIELPEWYASQLGDLLGAVQYLRLAHEAANRGASSDAALYMLHAASNCGIFEIVENPNTYTTFESIHATQLREYADELAALAGFLRERLPPARDD